MTLPPIILDKMINKEYMESVYHVSHNPYFALSENDFSTHLIEVKLTDFRSNGNLLYFKNRNSGLHFIQLVYNLRYDIERDGIEIVRAGEWLAKLEA